MKARLWLLSLLVLTFALAGPRAQPQGRDELHIQLAGIDLTLGMRQEDALGKLSAVYDVSYDEAYKQWTVSKKGGSSYRPIGSVAFRSDRLAVVNKEWFDLYEATATAHAMATSNAIQAVAGQGRTCTASVEIQKKPPSPSSVVPALPDVGYWTTIRCGRRKVMMYSSVDAREVTTVREMLE